MARHIEFQFDDKLQYQLDAINSVIELFKGLPKKGDGIYGNTYRSKTLGENEPIRNVEIFTGEKLEENLNKVQLKNNLFATKLQGNDFTIEMETGTGKTYVYLRTILELNKEYGFTKFIIVVPSIAIRTGIEKSIKMLKDHFKALYGIDLTKHSFIYDSKNMKSISTNLVETRDISICIMNIQAFNKDNNKIRQEDEYGQILWRDIQTIKPIVIIDEPQKIEGDKKKKSQSLKAIEELEPLFTLRYSATHKKLYNQIYKLDSFDAFKNDLVKKIEVKTIHSTISKDKPYIRYLKFTSDLKAKIEIFNQEQSGRITFKSFAVRGGASLYDLSGGLNQYKDIRIQEEPHKLKPLKIATKENIIELPLGESNIKFHKTDIIKYQIRLTIKAHLDKQFEILDKGKKIKVLSLFFIDEVAKVRDNSREDGRGEYLRIFDEQYKDIIENDLYYKGKFEQYKELFPRYNEELAVREGYFAIDKNKKVVEVEGWNPALEENKLKAKSQEDVDRGIELILEKKDELISFDEPLAFIFSHSALREGWDNPNVFNICTLKQGSNEIAKKQEIGRGLRLPVDIKGNRSIDSEVNKLTVIANDTYENFASALQKDFNDNSDFDKNEVTPDIIYKTFVDAGIPKDKINSELINTLREELVKNNIIGTNNVLTKSANYINDIEFKNETLKEHAIKIKESLIKYMVEQGSKKITIINGDNEPLEPNAPHSYVTEEVFRKIINKLTRNLNKKTIYRANIDKDKFINECAKELNDYTKFMHATISFSEETGQGAYGESRQFKMGEAHVKVIEEGADLLIEKKSDLEIVNYIMYHTMLPRIAISKILCQLNNRLILNKQEVLEDITKKINNKLNKAKDVYEYEIIQGYELESAKILQADVIDEEMLKKQKAVYITDVAKRRAMNRYYRMDSDGEYEFAEKLENDSNILLFTKLHKGGFVIDTPYCNYSPDWAIVYKNDNGDAKLYFIVETKCGKNEENLTDVEKTKIKCAKLHFSAVSDEIKFDWVNSYKDFKEKVSIISGV